MTFRMGPVGGLARPAAPVSEGDWTDARGRLTEAGRAVIALRLGEGHRPARIAAELGVHRSSVTRELARNRVGGVYSVRIAQQR
ncbi:helix-turn-helix domain-containing protein, partial [Terrabacter sp. 2YAF2]|uniref:helix-turn-helix domain-containing protein n=1 Tax=Terrabacter sp. 2YAF2 TaxID=3233026 RepID=UPI003F95ED65